MWDVTYGGRMGGQLASGSPGYLPDTSHTGGRGYDQSGQTGEWGHDWTRGKGYNLTSQTGGRGHSQASHVGGWGYTRPVMQVVGAMTKAVR